MTIDSLLPLVGISNSHIVMQPGGTDKYRFVPGRITPVLWDMHLRGQVVLGSDLRYPAGHTHMLIFDADNSDDWYLLQRAAESLRSAGGRVWLETSPARGGHMGMAFEEVVVAADAIATVLERVPELEAVEYFPTSGGKQVRLPGSRYRRDDIDAWCTLRIEGHNAEFTGRKAIEAILNNLTPVAFVTKTAPPARSLPRKEKSGLDRSVVPVGAPRLEPSVTRDQTWRAENHYRASSLYFHFAPELVAAWFNETHRVENLAPSNDLGYALATWRGEDTASVKLYMDENEWEDFGAKPTRDGGDCFELYCRIQGLSRSEALKILASKVAKAAKRELEDAAKEGRNPIKWVFDITSSAGWRYYDSLLGEREP